MKNSTVMKSIKIFIVISVLLVPMLARSDTLGKPEYLVKVIYFKTSDAEDIDQDKYEKIFRQIQTFFRDEMLKHGYGAKTIKYETDDEDFVKVHTITAKHDGEHYSGQTFKAFYEKISKEIPYNLNTATNFFEQLHHYIIILAGVPLIPDGLGNGYIGNGWTYASTDPSGGTSVINAQYELDMPDHYKSLIIHEFAHTFDLDHSPFYTQDELMSVLPFDFPKYISEENAAILDKHHAFSIVPIADPIISEPEIVIDADVNDDGYVDLYDVLIVRSAMSQPNNYDTDVNDDGITNEIDLLIVKAKAFEAIAAASPRKRSQQRRIKLTTWGEMKNR